MTKLSEIISKLCKFYWSEEPPENYVLSNGAGLGRIAKQDYAAFNLAWKFSNGALQTFDEHKAAVVVLWQFKNRAYWTGPSKMVTNFVI